MKLPSLIKMMLLCLSISLAACTYTTQLGEKFLPDSEYNTLLVKADSAMHDGEWAKAAAFYEKAVQLKPGNWDLKLKQAQAYRNDGKLSQAYNAYQMIIDAKTASPYANDITLKTAKENQAKLGFKVEPIVSVPATSSTVSPEAPKATEPEMAESHEQTLNAAAKPQEAKAEPEAIPAKPLASTTLVEEGQHPLASKPDVNQSKLVMDEVAAWAKAWASKNVDIYFAHYVDGFAGEYGNSTAWQKSRKAKILKSKPIKISFSDIQINNISAELVEVTFKQTYQSGGYQDVGSKTLEMTKVKDRWLITKELFK